MDSIEQFQEWAKKGERYVEIKISNLSYEKSTKIWVFDLGTAESQFVQTVDEIDLEGKKAKGELAKYEDLKKKYGEVKTDG